MYVHKPVHSLLLVKSIPTMRLEDSSPSFLNASVTCKRSKSITTCTFYTTWAAMSFYIAGDHVPCCSKGFHAYKNAMAILVGWFAFCTNPELQNRTFEHGWILQNKICSKESLFTVFVTFYQVQNKNMWVMNATRCWLWIAWTSRVSLEYFTSPSSFKRHYHQAHQWKWDLYR